jgi:hypothetical protein
MSPADLATLSLLDPDQGVCPHGHRCHLGDVVGERVCRSGEYRGLALICWDISSDGVEVAERAGGDPRVVAWARSYVAERA